MMTRGEGGLTFPTEDAASTPTATSPSAETRRHSLAKELGKGVGLVQHSDVRTVIWRLKATKHGQPRTGAA